MPELPEVETVMRGLSPHLIDSTIAWVETRRDGLRYPFPDRMEERLEGRRVIDMSRRAKYLLIHLDDGFTWLCHLGMSGRFTIHEDGLPAESSGSRGGDGHGKHDHVVFGLENGTEVVYTDHRRFGNGFMVHQSAFYFGGSDAVSGHIHHIINTAQEP